MKLATALATALVLLAVAGFCLFGFLATFEPTDHQTQSLVLRIVYALLGVAAVGGAVRALVRGAGRGM